VKATIFFRGRERAHPEIGLRILERLLVELENEAIAENQPRQEGNTMHVILAKKPGSGPAKSASAPRPAPRPAAAPAGLAALATLAGPLASDTAPDVEGDAEPGPEDAEPTA